MSTQPTSLEQKQGVIWLNGKFVDWADAQVHVLTHTLHYGSGVFEGERAYNGQIFKITEHHERLHKSAEMLDFKIPYTVQELNDAANEVLKRNNLTNAYLRPVAWHGAEALNVSSTKNSVNVAIAAWEWTSFFTGNSGLKLMWADWTRPAPTMAPVHAKANGQYIIGTLSKNKAEKTGYHDALMLDYRGYVAECTGANIFIVKNGVMYTPIADCFLNGITRQTVIELGRQCGYTVEEKHIMPDEIKTADEIFVTGSAAEVQPVVQVGEQTYAIGPITQRIQTEYQNLVNGNQVGARNAA